MYKPTVIFLLVLYSYTSIVVHAIRKVYFIYWCLFCIFVIVKYRAMISFSPFNNNHHPVLATDNNIQPRHTAGLFLKLLTPVKTPVYLTLLNNPFSTTSFPINYKTMILLSVKPAFSSLNKTKNMKTPRLNKEGTFYRKPQGCYVKSGRSHSRRTPPLEFGIFPLGFSTRNLEFAIWDFPPWNLEFVFWNLKTRFLNHFVTTP